jgi:hypothetical protein
MPPPGARPDPFGLGQGQPIPGAPQRPGMPMGVPPRADGGEALLREALSKASQDVIEKIAWEVVPQLAETIIRQELDRLIKEREGR